MTNTYAFRDPAEKQEESWRLVYKGQLLKPTWNSKGAAEAHVTALEAGLSKPHFVEEK